MNQMSTAEPSGPRGLAASFAATANSPGMRKNFADAMGLPHGDVQVDRFTRVMIRAVQEDPKLLEADKNSLFLACQRAAQDNLMPDGKQGKLVVYNTKQGSGWISKVQWQPMIGGLRLIAARHDFDIRAEVVCENDEFDYEQGDNPSIHHKQPKLGQPRGDIIGAYAIATHADGRRYREVMDRASIEKVKQASKGKDAGPWVSWFDEMARKTVAKRLFKALPFYEDDEQLQGVIKRDNEDYGDDQAVPTSSSEAAPESPRTGDQRPRAYAKVSGEPEVRDEQPATDDGEFTESPPADGDHGPDF